MSEAVGSTSTPLASASGPGVISPGALEPQAWLTAQCGWVPGVRHGVLVLGPADTGPFTPVALWPQGAAFGAELVAAADQCLSDRAPVALLQGQGCAVACPVWQGNALRGIAALALSPRSEADLARTLQALQWGVAGVALSLWQAGSEDDAALRDRLITSLNLLAATLGEQNHAAAASLLTSELAQRLDCDRVSYGVLKGGHAQVKAISHTARFAERMSLVSAIAAAMDEALDQKATIVLPATAEVLVTRDHAQLARQHGCDVVMTIPFHLTDGRAGAFTFERPAGQPFDEATLALCHSVVALCARLLDARLQSERPWWLQAKEQWLSEVRKLTGPDHPARKVLAMGALGLVLLAATVQGEYRVHADARLEGAVRRVLIAPFDGYVETAEHRAGEQVKAGTVIATLDPRELNLEYLRWASQNEQFSRQYQEAMAAGDRAQSQIMLAQVQQAQAQMDLLAEHLARARITAPFDGLIVSGDLKQDLGSAVQRGQVLFEVAPLNAYRVILEVDDADIEALKPGQHGQLALTALPGQRFPFTVQLVTPVTQAKAGRSVFRVEATLNAPSPSLRPGMEGVGKVETGSRNLFWIWTHRLIDRLRLMGWSWT